MSYKRQIKEVLYQDIDGSHKKAQINALKKEIKDDYNQRKREVGRGLVSFAVDINASRTGKKTKRKEAIAQRKRNIESGKQKLIKQCEKAIDRIPQIQAEVFEIKRSADLARSEAIIILIYAIAALDGIVGEEREKISALLSTYHKKLRVLTLQDFKKTNSHCLETVLSVSQGDIEEDERLLGLCALITREARALEETNISLRDAKNMISNVINADGRISPAEAVVSKFLDLYWFDKNGYNKKRGLEKTEYKILIKAEKTLERLKGKDKNHPKIKSEIIKCESVIKQFNPTDGTEEYISKVTQRTLYLGSSFKLKRSASGFPFFSFFLSTGNRVKGSEEEQEEVLDADSNTGGIRSVLITLRRITGTIIGFFIIFIGLMGLTEDNQYDHWALVVFLGILFLPLLSDMVKKILGKVLTVADRIMLFIFVFFLMWSSGII